MTQHVKIKVFCCNDHLVAEYTDEIREKYPFFCYSCPGAPEDLREGKYPWYATTEIVDDGPAAAREVAEVNPSDAPRMQLPPPFEPDPTLFKQDPWRSSC